MKRTVTQWTNIQYALRRMTPGKTYPMLVDTIENRTFGKQWSSQVGIALDKPTTALVEQAEKWFVDNPDA